jgi:hypothetical protein
MLNYELRGKNYRRGKISPKRKAVGQSGAKGGIFVYDQAFACFDLRTIRMALCEVSWKLHVGRFTKKERGTARRSPVINKNTLNQNHITMVKNLLHRSF